MQFTVNGKPLDVDLRHLTIAAWTGRDREAQDRHVADLVGRGFPAPPSIPAFYPVAASLLTQTETMQTVGPQTLGAAGPMLVQIGRKRYLGLASDHSDGALAVLSAPKARQVCAKPCARALWPWEEVADRLDDLRLESWVADADSDWEPCQRGTLADILPLADLAGAAGLAALASDGAAAMLCGTLPPLAGKAPPAARFRMSLTDDARSRAIRHQYDVEDLPEIG